LRLTHNPQAPFLAWPERWSLEVARVMDAEPAHPLIGPRGVFHPPKD
jgi:hypothetical protein